MSKTGIDHATVTLKRPILRGEQEIKEVTLREPMSGELRDISMIDLIQLKAETISVLIPRISKPVLNDDDMRTLCAADLFALASEVANFLLPEGAVEPSLKT